MHLGVEMLSQSFWSSALVDNVHCFPAISESDSVAHVLANTWYYQTY